MCEQRLEEYTSRCNITDGLGRITRDSHDQFWVGYDQSHGLILHPHCPLDYCVSHTVEFPLNNTDLQCAYQRTGHLCGACKRGYSLVLGTSQCTQCTNSHLAYYISKSHNKMVQHCLEYEDVQDVHVHAYIRLRPAQFAFSQSAHKNQTCTMIMT